MICGKRWREEERKGERKKKGWRRVGAVGYRVVGLRVVEWLGGRVVEWLSG